jgi:hypothetical protein
VRVIAPRENAPEAEFRRHVSESIRDMGRALEEGVGLSGLRVQQVEIEVVGGDVDLDIRLDPTRIARTPPWGVLCVYAIHQATKAAGSLDGSVKWTYRSQGNDGYVRVASFPGFSTGEKYLVRFLIIGGE